MAVLDVIAKIATVIIAGSNLTLAFFVFKQTKETNASEKQKDRNIQAFKTLILDHSLKHLYTFFDNIEIVFKTLEGSENSLESKQNVDKKLNESISIFRRQFVDSLLSVDTKLYDLFLEKTDTFQALISTNLFDEGINIHVESKYVELINNPMTNFRTELLKTLYSFKG
ncbi:hypothetical protein [Pedobacter agri]|uniref:Uncharacterized protein n=1 Tax=Pedobacter agri TaxID=454586 RepID=A0A9X3DC07_9SPHI|nr:hypothetical protein [Pedobacter agri]MCX3264923.1 hypothetical protein [Pedobacter agri]